MCCTQMLPIMYIPVSYANQLAMTKILGQLHIFQVPLQHKTKVGRQLKKKPAYAVLKSIQRFDYYLRGAKCTLRYDHKPLEPFLTRSMKIAKLDRWVILLQEYDITFVHIRGKDNILADAISRLCTINVYEKALENKQHHSLGTQDATHSSQKAEQIQQLDSATPLQLLNMNTTMLQILQKQDKFCKK